ncbi:MAG: DUF7487 domain-containing protein [Cetobacterium sp.]
MGQTKYNNYKKILEENNYEVCSFEEFVRTDKISYKCEKGHTTKMATTSFQNKKTKTTDMKNLCTECFSEATSLALFEEQKVKILNHTGHKLMKQLPERKIEYICGTCNSVQISTFSNLIKPTSTKFCSKCINDRTTKKTMDQVQLDFANLKLENNDLSNYCVLKYETNKTVTFKCNIGHIFITSFFDIKRGRRCPTCSPVKRTETNLQKYGHANVFASPQIKEKIKETNIEKFGVTHHMKVKEIRDKAVQTNLEKIGVKYAFHTEESFQKIQSTCLERYGVKFPLQNKFIQAKISQHFLETIGANRPMANQEYWKNCLLDLYGVDHYSKTDQFKIDYVKTCMAKYGVDHYSKTDQFKIDYVKTCMAKYGVDHYSKTDQFKIDYKHTCLTKYGVDHPMKTKEVFSRAMSSSFRRKPFTFPSGRVDYVLGYEPTALKELLKTYDEADIITSVWCIPTFDYNRISSKSRPFKKLQEDEPCCSSSVVAPSVSAALCAVSPMQPQTIRSRYFPDIMLPDRNRKSPTEGKIIEVKSSYYYHSDKENVRRKMFACVRNGYSAEVWVYRALRGRQRSWYKDEMMLDFKIEFFKKNESLGYRFFK